MKKFLIPKLKTLPSKPGVYLFYNKLKVVLYVGKAKNLKKRVSSYFVKKNNLSPDKLIMISQISNIDYIITDSEAEALLLESTLIKKHEPRFNIVLKDDKSYLYIKIDLKQEWPKVYAVRRPNLKDGNFYAGPYPSADSVRQTLKLAGKIFKFCACKNFLKKPCLRYHLGWCLCPALTKISNTEYRKIFDKVKKFLRGQTDAVIRELKTEMKKASSKKRYEDAARLRDQIHSIEKTTAKQKVISTKLENYDVVSLAREADAAGVNLFVIREGKLINKLNFILKHIQHSTDAEIIKSFISQHYLQAADIPKEIVIPQKIKNPMPQVSYLAPQQGKKHQLLNLGAQNAREYLKNQETRKPSQSEAAVSAFGAGRPLAENQENNRLLLKELQSALCLPTIPARLEAFDISNIQGQNATGSMVVFTNGKPDKSQYRKFKIKTVGNVNDVAMMSEVAHRRLKNKDWPKPDLILIDGGRPQLNVVLGLMPRNSSLVPIIALAKREEQIFIPNRKNPVILPKTSPVLQLLQRVRDEAHRFARAYYIKRHQKESIRSALDEIPGVGPKIKKKLLRKFGSLENIRKAKDWEIEKAAGKKLVGRLREHL